MVNILLCQGTALALPLRDASVHCVVTSPPYYGLRDYGTGTWQGGDAACAHQVGLARHDASNGRHNSSTFHGSMSTEHGGGSTYYAGVCGRCGATRVDQQLGREASPDAYVAAMVQVFRDVYRVLRPDGTLWLNMGDSFSSGHATSDTSRTHKYWGGFSYGTSGTAPANCQDGDSSSYDLCDECRAVLTRRTAHTDSLPAHESGVYGDAPSQDHRGLDAPFLHSVDLIPQESTAQSYPAMPDLSPMPARVDVPPLDAQASTMPGSSPQPLDVCSHCANCGACLAVLRSSLRESRLCARRSAYKHDTVQQNDSLASRIGDKESSCMALSEPPYVQTYYATKQLPAKNLMGMPWRVAFALQQDGWILRSDIIWDKPSCMPESVQDRPTRSHEYVFLCSKSPRYFYDQEATREPHSREWWYESVGPKYMQASDGRNDGGKREGNGTPSGRNARTVWRIPSEAFSGSHFATFPPALVRRCLLAGAPTQVCAKCGAPWRREVERGESSWAPRKAAGHDSRGYHVGNTTSHHAGNPCVANQAPPGISTGGLGWVAPKGTIGFAASCTCNAGTQPATILDPFCGSGTSLLVARELGHHAIGLDLSYRYLHDIARERLGLAALAAWTHGQTAQPVTYADLPLFGARSD